MTQLNNAQVQKEREPMKTSPEFLRRVFEGGVKQFEAPPPPSLVTNVLCNELKVIFLKDSTVFQLLQNGVVVGEREVLGKMKPGDSVTFSDLHLYWKMEMMTHR